MNAIIIQLAGLLDGGGSTDAGHTEIVVVLHYPDTLGRPRGWHGEVEFLHCKRFIEHDPALGIASVSVQYIPVDKTVHNSY